VNPIDVDPKTLEVFAQASAHAYEQGILHIAEEIKARDPDNLSALIGSLAPQGPYAYTILPEIRSDGSVRLPVLTTREEIADAYAFIRGRSDLHEVIGLNEVRGAWYLFQDGLSLGSPKGADVVNTNQTLGLFPCGVDHGITGELVWRRVPRSGLGAADEADAFPADGVAARQLIQTRYAEYVAGLRANDLDGVLAVLHDLSASAIRDYVADTGTLVELTGKDAHRAWYSALFDKYEIEAVQPLIQLTEDWYVFADLRITARERHGGARRVFHTAEFHVPAKDGRFIARIGHGTEPV
jgi:hypothetical protein